MPHSASDWLDPLTHAVALIRCESVTPDQAGALDYMQQVLGEAGFACRRLTFTGDGGVDTDNLYARIGTGAPHLCLAGHIDVVPPGDAAAWSHPPFAAEVAGGILHGRGAADMKGGVAAMMAAALRFLSEVGEGADGSLSFLITADEEGRAINGTRKVVAWMRENGEMPDHCLLGEPTNDNQLGETIKIGRRGSLNGRLTVTGRQGHVAYPHLANNPLSGLVAVLKAYDDEVLDEGTADFAPSNLEVTSIDTGNPTVNVIPARAEAKFNIRFNDSQNEQGLEQRLTALADRELRPAGLTYALELEMTAEAFVTRPGDWTAMLAQAVHETTGRHPELSTGGGTSDARYIKDICPVVEFGLVNKTIHQVDEHVPVADLHGLTAIYTGFLRRYFGSARDGG
jgi:succinyl-diaminopimelate desuccinylase